MPKKYFNVTGDCVFSLINMVLLFRQDPEPRIPEVLPGRVLVSDRRKIREAVIWNHLGYLGFTNESPNIWHKKPCQTLSAIYTKYFSRV